MGTVMTISGIMKPFLIPLIAAIGIILMPILAGIALYRGDKEAARSYLGAFGACVLILGACAAYLYVSAYHMPLNVSVAVSVCLVALSVILHIRGAMHAPKLKTQ